jgi:hypothetical protein
MRPGFANKKFFDELRELGEIEHLDDCHDILEISNLKNICINSLTISNSNEIILPDSLEKLFYCGPGLANFDSLHRLTTATISGDYDLTNTTILHLTTRGVHGFPKNLETLTVYKWRIERTKYFQRGELDFLKCMIDGRVYGLENFENAYLIWLPNTLKNLMSVYVVAGDCTLVYSTAGWPVIVAVAENLIVKNAFYKQLRMVEIYNGHHIYA